MADDERTIEYTDIQLQFLNLLKKYPLKGPETIVDYVTSQGETILEDPERLAVVLADTEITPVRRRQILKHWFADKNILVSEDLIHKAGLPPDERRKAEQEEAERRERARAKYSVDEDTGVIKVASTSENALTMEEAEKLSKKIEARILAAKIARKEPAVKYVYDSDTGQVRMAKEGEPGGTIEQAKDLKKMGETKKAVEEGESPFSVDSEGNWILNPKAKISGMEVLAFEALRRAQAKGEPMDPLEAMTQAAERMKVYQEMFGGGAKAPDLLQMFELFAKMTERRGPDKGDEGLKAQLTAVQDELRNMRDQQYRDQIQGLQIANTNLATKLNELAQSIKDLPKPVTGRTELDLIHDVATEGVALLRTELPGVRGDIRAALTGGGPLPPPKTVAEREDRRQKYHEALDKDAEIEDLGQKLFFPKT